MTNLQFEPQNNLAFSMAGEEVSTPKGQCGTEYKTNGNINIRPGDPQWRSGR